MIERISDLKYVLCCFLCFLSMVLTACFSWSFGAGIEEGSSQLKIYGALALLVLIGLVLDLSKYVFWSASAGGKNRIYRSMAIVLMLFSWLASVAFFISSEKHKLSQVRENTAEYKAYSAKLEGLTRQISGKQRQFSQRIESKFHDQWDRSDSYSVEIKALTDEQYALILKEPKIGIETAAELVSSMAFFNSVAGFLNVDVGGVRNSFYALLALLIELCAFGLLSLCEFHSHNARSESEGCNACSMENFVHAMDEISEVVESNVAGIEEQLIADIRSGKVAPVFNQLKGNYDLSHVKIRTILTNLKEEGVLVAGARRSLQLAG